MKTMIKKTTREFSCLNFSGEVQSFLKKDSITVNEHKEWLKYLTSLHDRKETVELLEMYYERGYRYLARENEEYLVLFNKKPKKYMKDGFWGYKDQDLKYSDTKPSEVIKNKDIQEIKFKNKSATLIKDFITNK